MRTEWKEWGKSQEVGSVCSVSDVALLSLKNPIIEELVLICSDLRILSEEMKTQSVLDLLKEDKETPLPCT